MEHKQPEPSIQEVKRTPEDITALLAAHVHLSALAWERSPEMSLLIRTELKSWFEHLVGRGFGALPLCLVLDIALLLAGGDRLPLRSQEAYERWHPEERALRLSYESELICRLPMMPKIRELMELGLMGALPPAQLKRALEVICKPLLSRCPPAFKLTLQETRRVSWDELSLTEPSTSAFTERSDELEEGAPLSAERAHLLALSQLRALLEALSQGFPWGELVSDADLFELRHWERLFSEDLRIGCRQLISVSERLGELNVSELIIAREDSSHDAQYTDDTTYPTGGITELTTSGAWENLVLSELIYIDDERPDQVDLFDLRFVENELLFYLRDEGQLSSKRRAIDLVIDLGSLFSYKSNGYEVQFSTLALGLINRALRDLSALYHGDALRFSVHVLTREEAPEPFEHELKLLQLLLLDEEQRGLVSFQTTPHLNAQALKDPKRKRYALIFTEEARLEHWREELRRWRAEDPVSASLLILSADEALSAQHKQGRGEPPLCELRLPLHGLSFEALLELKTYLIAQLIDARLKKELTHLTVLSADEALTPLTPLTPLTKDSAHRDEELT